MEHIIDALLKQLRGLHFGPPVSHVYNPLTYARPAYTQYCKRFGRPPKEIILLGMNPGPWGMAQTGIPFGDAVMVREWLGIQEAILPVTHMHPKRPIQGFACTRREVSGQRLWGWAKERFKTPRRFFQRFWVANYCPLVFLEASGRNRTPDKIPRAERAPLLLACDQALRQTVDQLRPIHVIGVGAFAAQSARRALDGTDVRVGQITHPSPANPKANRGWKDLIEDELGSLNIKL